MLMVFLTVALILISYIIVISVSSAWIKILTGVVCSFCIVLVTAYTMTNVDMGITPIKFDDSNNVITYSIMEEGKDKEKDVFHTSEVTQVTVQKSGMNVDLTIVANGKFHLITMNSWYYQWSIKNDIVRKFGDVLTDTTI